MRTRLLTPLIVLLTAFAGPAAGGLAPPAAVPSTGHAAAVAGVVPYEATVVPLQVTGPPAERLNLIVMGDGYTAAEMQRYRDHVDLHLNVLWSIEPFRSYRNYFNVYSIEIESLDSGISCDPDDGNERRNTPLQLQYASACPAEPNARGITYGPLGSLARDLIYLPMLPEGITAENRQTLALANTDTYGGIGGVHATTSGGSPQGPLITPHELGHSLGNLQDEYPYSARGVPGPAYTGGEPSSIHHTLRTVPEMLDEQAKWWRWMGEESESGGVIDRYESGQYAASGIWRPSRHSMMRWIGYYFDQVSRERMTDRITGRRHIGEMSLPSTPQGEVGPDDVVWVEPTSPTYHALEITWRHNGTPVEGTGNAPHLDLGTLPVAQGDTIEVTVTDPTEFVRDPDLRASGRLTQTRSWTVGAPLPEEPVSLAFTGGTATSSPVGRDEVVYVETDHPTDRVLGVAWYLDDVEVPNPHNLRTFDLGSVDLGPGTHHLRAVLRDPADPDAGEAQVQWTVDATLPQVAASLSDPVAAITGDEPHHVYCEEFTMGLEASDDSPGHVVAEFRLDGDGWFNYFGWPDAPAGTPFLFTPTGTEIKALVYGALSPGGMSWAPFEDREPGYGTHRVEYRAIDPAGNIGEASAFLATVLPDSDPQCTGA